ncbi:MAG: hypothetical protein ACI8XB_003215 [Patiriisocius sp.]|jgi:hypothetical protein
MEWISLKDRVPEDQDKVICYLPNNYQYLPGKSGEERHEPIVILRFVKDFFAGQDDKIEKHGPHFWLGEGLSNHYFGDVTHWMKLPEMPN